MTHKRLAAVLGIGALGVYVGLLAYVFFEIGRLPFAAKELQLMWRGYSDVDVSAFAQAISVAGWDKYQFVLTLLDPAFVLLFCAWVAVTLWPTRRWLGLGLALIVACADLGENLLLWLQVSLLISPSPSIVASEPGADGLALAAYFTILKFPAYLVALLWTLRVTMRKQTP